MKFHTETVKASFDSPLGPMFACASPAGLCGLWFKGQKHFFESDIAHLSPYPLHPMLQKTERWLSAYFSSAEAGAGAELPALDLSAGTDFQQRVWRALLQIGSGTSKGYGALAQQLGSPKAARALGAAVGKNPVSLIVPCHRVVGASGALTGYAGGLDKKTWLLQHEGALT